MADTWTRGRTGASRKVPHLLHQQLIDQADWIYETPFAAAGAIDAQHPVTFPATLKKNRECDSISFSFPPKVVSIDD
jgi:hypothetical protein